MHVKEENIIIRTDSISLNRAYYSDVENGINLIIDYIFKDSISDVRDELKKVFNIKIMEINLDRRITDYLEYLFTKIDITQNNGHWSEFYYLEDAGRKSSITFDFLRRNFNKDFRELMLIEMRRAYRKLQIKRGLTCGEAMKAVINAYRGHNLKKISVNKLINLNLRLIFAIRERDRYEK